MNKMTETQEKCMTFKITNLFKNIFRNNFIYKKQKKNKQVISS